MEPYSPTPEFYETVGHITVAWQTAEIPLDLIAGILFWRAGSNELSDELPVSFAVKVKFCKRCFNQLPNLADLQDAAKIVLTEAKRLSKERHRVTHGLVDNFTPVKPGVIVIRRIVYEKTKHLLEETTTSLEEMKKIAIEIDALGAAFRHLLEHLCKKFGIESEAFG
jgi:hypothetical protein